jgi:hypothetical protein
MTDLLPNSSDWESTLLTFIRTFRINFICLELLMLFYRGKINHATLEDIASQTGYHQQELQGNIAHLVEERLIIQTTHGTNGRTLVRYRRLEELESSGRRPLWQMLQQMAKAFDDRQGRLQLIYAVMKAQEVEAE